MSDTVHIIYRWSRENLEKLFDASYRYHYTHSARRYIGWFFIALLQFGVVAALKKGAIGLLLFSTIMLLYWYGIRRWITKRRALQDFALSDFKGEEIRIDADREGLYIHASNPGTSGAGKKWRWEEIDAVVSLGDDVLLYKAPYAHYIPASGFASVEEKSRFKSFAKKQGKLQL